MAEILETDRFDDSRDGSKVCLWCGAPVLQARGASSIGMCQRHDAVYNEDIEAGLRNQNRLREIILRSKLQTNSPAGYEPAGE